MVVQYIPSQRARKHPPPWLVFHVRVGRQAATTGSGSCGLKYFGFTRFLSNLSKGVGGCRSGDKVRFFRKCNGWASEVGCYTSQQKGTYVDKV